MLKYINRRKGRGFTLLELIVVIVILGILAAIAIPTFNTATNKTYNASTAATVAAMLKDTAALAGVSGRTTFEKADFENALKETSVFNGGYEINAGTTTQTSWSQATVNGVRKVGVTFYKNGVATTDTSGTQLDTAVVVDKTKHCVFGRLNGNTVQTWTVEKDLGSNCAGSMLSSIVGAPGSSSGGGGVNTSTGTLPVTVLPYVAPDNTAPTTSTASAGSVGLTSAVINWTAATDASGIEKYVVKYLTVGSPAGTTPSETTLNSTTTTATITGLKAATSYTVTVEAYDKWGNKSTSTPLTISTSNTVSDNFDRSGGLGNTSTGNAPWQVLSGSWSTNGTAVASGTPAAAAVDAGVANLTAQVSTSTSNAAGGEALVMRASSNGDMLRARTERSSSVSTIDYGAALYNPPYSYYTCDSGYYLQSANYCAPTNPAANTGGRVATLQSGGGNYYCNNGNLSGGRCTASSTTYQTLLVLESVAGGTPTNLGSAVLGSGTPSYIKATLNGDQVNVFTNLNAGTPAISATSSFNQSATLFGIGRAAGSQPGLQDSALDNFVLTL